MPKLVNIIVACSENRAIGRAGKLPWKISEDAVFFERETAGQVCVLGRICFETWPNATRDARRTVVVTRKLHYSGPGVHLAASFPEALAIADTLPGEIFICGGERIYEETLALDRPMRLLLTLIHAEIEGDTFFPEWRHLAWREVARRESANEKYRYTFLTLERERG